MGYVRSLFILMAATVAFCTLTAVMLWKQGYAVVAGPIIGAAVSIVAVLVSETARYCSSTSRLKLSAGFANDDPGLDVEPLQSSYRVSAMVMNDGEAIVRNAKASLTIKVRKDGQESYFLNQVMPGEDEIKQWCGVFFLVNTNNPHVVGEELAWALPESGAPLPSPVIMPVLIKDGRQISQEQWPVSARPEVLSLAGYYQHITSISPGQRNRLLLFEFKRFKGSNREGYLLMPFSEYGAPGPNDLVPKFYRACLMLTKGYELVFEVTVYGEGARSPLRFMLCISVDKLQKIENALQRLTQDGAGWRDTGNSSGSKLFEELQEALKSLKCAEGQPGGLRALAKKFEEWLGGCLS